MPDIFGRETVFGDSMSADGTIMTFAAQGLVSAGLLLQDVRVGYRQPITRLYALESNKVYFVGGRPDGTMEATHVIGPAGMQKDFYTAYGNVCNAGGNFTISAKAGCGGGAGAVSGTASLTVKTPVITEIRLSVTTENFIIFSGFTATFVGLE
jgi:hypothetical protein